MMIIGSQHKTECQAAIKKVESVEAQWLEHLPLVQ